MPSALTSLPRSPLGYASSATTSERTRDRAAKRARRPPPRIVACSGPVKKRMRHPTGGWPAAVIPDPSRPSGGCRGSALGVRALLVATFASLSPALSGSRACQAPRTMVDRWPAASSGATHPQARGQVRAHGPPLRPPSSPRPSTAPCARTRRDSSSSPDTSSPMSTTSSRTTAATWSCDASCPPRTRRRANRYRRSHGSRGPRPAPRLRRPRRRCLRHRVTAGAPQRSRRRRAPPGETRRRPGPGRPSRGGEAGVAPRGRPSPRSPG